MKTGEVTASCAYLFVVRHAAGHPGEMRCHPSDQLSGSVRRWGYGRRRLPELHHMHRDVFRGNGSAARFHIQRVQGQKSRFNRWEGRRGKRGGRKHLSYNIYRLKKEFKKSFTSCLSSISFPFVSMHIFSFMPHLFFFYYLSFCLRLYFSPPNIPFFAFYLPVSTYLSSFFIFSSLLHSKGPVPTYGQFGRLNSTLVCFHTAAISILIYWAALSQQFLFSLSFIFKISYFNSVLVLVLTFPKATPQPFSLYAVLPVLLPFKSLWTPFSRLLSKSHPLPLYNCSPPFPPLIPSFYIL